MREDPPINPPSMNLALWLTVVAIIMGMVIPPIYEEPQATPTLAEKTMISQVPASASLQEKSEPAEPDNIIPLISWNAAERLFHPIVIEAANRYEVEPAMVMAIIMAESSYNPRAISKKGAKGLMQLMPITAKSLGVIDSFDPEHNIKAGVRYYRKLLNQFNGDVKLALAAYNAGSRKVREHQGVPPFRATKYYIKKVFRYYRYYKKQMEADRVYS